MALNILTSTSGKIYDKNENTGSYGLIVTLRNAELRGKVWSFVGGCFHSKTGDYAAYDERGQVFIFSLSNNEYFTARLASFPVTCMEFVHCDPTKLIVSYSHGFTVIINTHTREIELNIKFRDVDPFVAIKCHPTKPLATFMTEKGKLLVWDLQLNKCLRILDCPDVIGFSYARNGTLLALCFRSSPVVFYRISDYEAVMICDLPSRYDYHSSTHLSFLVASANRMLGRLATLLLIPQYSRTSYSLPEIMAASMYSI